MDEDVFIRQDGGGFLLQRTCQCSETSGPSLTPHSYFSSLSFLSLQPFASSFEVAVKGSPTGANYLSTETFLT